MLPRAEHRQCARHICSNMKKRFSGALFENLFWSASKATTEYVFKVVMEEIKKLNPLCHSYLMEKDPKTWSRAYFREGIH